MSAAAPAPATTFALTPATATNDVIDYSTKHGSILWDRGSAKLSDEPFDCTPEGLRDFLELLRKRSKIMGWDTSVLAVPDDASNLTGDAKDYLDHYGEISLEHLTEVAKTYATNKSRATQDSMMLYTCLHESLSKIGRDKVTLHAKEYTVDGFETGILFLKMIVRESMIDTNATTSTIRDQLIELHTYLAQTGFDIAKMNQHAQMLLEGLRARGETTNDLLNNLFKAYKTVKDDEFLTYIKAKESDWHEGEMELTAEKLMLLAKNKFQLLKDQKKWQAPSAAEEKIIALEARLAAIKRDGNKTPNRGNQKNRKQGNRNYQGNQRGKDQNQKKDGKRREKEPWMLVEPKDDQPRQKTVDGKAWYWCAKHREWCRHSTEQCKGAGIKGGDTKGNAKTNQRALRAQQATVRWGDINSDSDEE